jgi:uncharacterized protein (DUF2164 family)
MTDINFNADEKKLLVAKLQQYFAAELDQTLGQFDAEFLLDFFADNIGAYYYNRGLYDAQALFTSRVEDIGEAIYELEKPT